ncbi:MAG TPA: hypothetical protein DDW66_07770 [Porphyromonadaceae bacterium]|nr:hypothetical protein [Porphyromonadaceae bacterium]
MFALSNPSDMILSSEQAFEDMNRILKNKENRNMRFTFKYFIELVLLFVFWENQRGRDNPNISFYPDLDAVKFN